MSKTCGGGWVRVGTAARPHAIAWRQACLASSSAALVPWSIGQDVVPQGLTSSAAVSVPVYDIVFHRQDAIRHPRYVASCLSGTASSDTSA